jgi:MoaA/NifB/PqqE/SkfB family radical SAM enzyme
VAGSFERLLRNVAQMAALGLRVKMNATLTAWNESEAERMFALADGLGVRLQFDPEVTPRDDGDRSPLELTASREGVLNLLRLEYARAGGGGEAEVGRQADELMGPVEGGKHCGAGSSGIAVDPFGNVYPCVQWRRAVGNLHDSPIRQIWERSPRLREVRDLSAEVKTVVGQEADGPLLAFCPGTAEALAGSPFAIYRGARQRATLAREAEQERKTIPLRVLPPSGR